MKYMRLTIAPNIREKRKEGNKSVKFDKSQLIYQIRNAIKSVSDDSQDVESVLSGVFVSEKKKNLEFVIGEIGKESVRESIITKRYPGVVGQFSGPLHELSVGVAIAVGNSNMLQLYESQRYGYVPSTLEPQSLEDWDLVEEIMDYDYVTYPTKPDIVFLKF